MYNVNATPVAPTLQICPNEDDFFAAIEKLEKREENEKGALTALAEIISESLDRTGGASETVDPYAEDDDTSLPVAPGKRRGPKLKSPGPFVKLRLWCLYPGTGAPRRLGTLYSQRLEKRSDPLATRCGFGPKNIPDRGTTRERFLKLDAHPDLLEAVLRAISAAFVQHYLIPPEPALQPEKKGSVNKTRTAEKNAHADRLGREALSPDEYNERFGTQWKREQFLLEYLHGFDLRCHHCITGKKKCSPCAGDRVYETWPRRPECPNPENHARHGTHEPRRQWRCRCCRNYLSVTAGTLLDGVKLPLRTVVRCIYNLVKERYWITVGEMSWEFNRRGKDGRRGSAHMLMHRIREAMDEEFAPFEGTTEIDTAQVKLPEGVIHLIGAFNVDTGRVRIEIIPKDADREIMAEFILRVTAPGSRIDTDGTASWPPWIPDREHHTVIHSAFDYAHREEIDGPDGKKKTIYVTTLHIEGSWGFLKRSLQIPLTVSHKHFPRYLAETQWRINRLHNKKEAEAYTGKERRNLILMGQIVSNMPYRWITVKEIREGKRARTEPQPPRCQTATDRDLPEEVELPRAA